MPLESRLEGTPHRMNGPAPLSATLTARRSAGPQGTRLFTAEELRRHAAELALPEDDISVARPVLEGRSTGLQGLRFALRNGKQTVGRRSDNDVVLGDPSVSASHAWIIHQHGQCVITNTLSTNGTFVNGRRIHQAVLRHGDRVRFGHAELVFLTREPGAGRLRRIAAITLGIALLAGLSVLGWRLI